MPRRLSLAIALTAIAAGSVAGCQKSQTAPAPTVSSVAISGNLRFTNVGQNSQLSAVATYSDGSTKDVTSQTTWESTNGSVASVSGAGKVSVLGFGDAKVRATFQSGATTQQVKFDIDMSGAWSGTVSDGHGGSMTYDIVISQSGDSITGSATVSSTYGIGGTGTFSGTISGSGVDAVFSLSATDSVKHCTLTVTGNGIFTPTSFDGTYSLSSDCLPGSITGPFHLGRR